MKSCPKAEKSGKAWGFRSSNYNVLVSFKLVFIKFWTWGWKFCNQGYRHEQDERIDKYRNKN